MNQCERVLDYMMKHPRGITQTEALYRLGVARLASRISELKKDGVKIISQREKVKNRYSENCYISRYFLIDESRGK